MAVAAAGPEDPLRSPSWPVVEQDILEGGSYRFDDRVRVRIPDNAEDSTRVPVHVTVDGLGPIRRVVIFADLNPIRRSVVLEPLVPMAHVSFGLQIKVQQATPVRAAVLDAEGIWHLGGGWVSAAGGGCTAPSIASADPAWQTRLGDAGSRLWRKAPGQEGSSRLRMSLVHPMDAGFVAGIPEFFLSHTVIATASGKDLLRVRSTASVSENPDFSVDLPVSEDLRIRARDNNGNRFAMEVAGEDERL